MNVYILLSFMKIMFFVVAAVTTCFSERICVDFSLLSGICDAGSFGYKALSLSA